MKKTIAILLILITNSIHTIGDDILIENTILRPDRIFFKSNSLNFTNKNLNGKKISNVTIFYRWKKLLEKHPRVDLELNGYRDKNEMTDLSFKRADKVKSELIKIGVEVGRIIIKDHGDTLNHIDGNRFVEFYPIINE
jgi:outer membrane protein OmpA-like peptidoglycan-associated protein